jgi:hypothetical protein
MLEERSWCVKTGGQEYYIKATNPVEACIKVIETFIVGRVERIGFLMSVSPVHEDGTVDDEETYYVPSRVLYKAVTGIDLDYDEEWIERMEKSGKPVREIMKIIEEDFLEKLKKARPDLSEYMEALLSKKENFGGRRS